MKSSKNSINIKRFQIEKNDLTYKSIVNSIPWNPICAYLNYQGKSNKKKKEKGK